MRRDHALEMAWRRRMRQYEKSGLTIREFCETHQLAAHQFSWWRAELKRRDGKTAAGEASSERRPKRKSNRSAGTSSFVAVQIDPPSPNDAVEIVLDQPPRIRVTAGFDANLLREVMRALESR